MSLAINKSRIKLYNKKSELPTYYLKSGQEFQLEIFNPTQDYILAMISLNNKLISHSGLVLRPGERIFLERYLDVDKKFLFDTYEVSSSNEVKEAIKNNGDIKIKFYKEKELPVNISYYGGTYTTTPFTYTTNTFGTTTTTNNTTFTTTGLYDSTVNSFTLGGPTLGGPTLDANTVTLDAIRSEPIKSKSIETGRVEKGSKSDQKFETVDKEFESYPFHTISYKLLPISQKNVEGKDLVKRYCTECGSKTKSNDKFCSKCGNKQ